jgi:carbamoyl-phosphate synthase large subunit
MNTPSRVVLVTGAGGPAAVTVIRALAGHAQVVAGDIDPLAVGLYLVPQSQRVLLRRGEDPAFIDGLLEAAIAHGATLVVPTVDSELLAVSQARDRFAAHGIAVLVESTATLAICLDKALLVRVCAPVVRVPDTIILDADGLAACERLGPRFIVKPRQGAGGRGFAIITALSQLDGLPRDGSYLAQEYLPGTEYSIDVLARPDGHIVAAVPRTRDRVDSGIAVAGRTVRDDQLESFGRLVAEAIGVTGVVNVQARGDAAGVATLLEVNARFPGTMSLTMAAGIDMPVLAVDAAYGAVLPTSLDFAELAVVRHWTDVAVPIEQYGRLDALAARP